MLIYRIENDECQGPYTTGEIPVTHQHWFRPPHWWKDTKCPENGRYGMDNLLDLYLIFKPCASDGEIWISVYECPDEHAVVLYSIYGCSRQVVFDITKATRTSRFQVPNSNFSEGHLEDECPKHLRKPS